MEVVRCDFVVNVSYEFKMFVGVMVLFVEVLLVLVDDFEIVWWFVEKVFIEVNWFGDMVVELIELFWL